MTKLLKNSVVIALLLGGCSVSNPFLVKEEERLVRYVEPTFNEDPIYNFKTRIDEGWELYIYKEELFFRRQTEDGLEIYKPSQ